MDASSYPPAGPTTQATEQKRFEGLDYVRGVAATLVVFAHLTQYIGAHASTPAWHIFAGSADMLVGSWLDFGKMGVAAFFCASGAIIPMSLKAKADSGRREALKKFATARFFRLYPAYWACVLLATLTGWSQLSDGELLANMTMLQRFLGVRDALGVFWTLQIELIFYAICAALFAAGWLHDQQIQDRTWRVMLALSVATAAARYVTGYKLPVALFLALTLMFFCCRFREAFIVSATERVSGPRVSEYVTLLAALLLVCILAYSRDYGHNETWYRYFISYVLGVALFIALAKAKWAHIGPSLRLLGECSYALYLFHPIVGFEVLERLERVLPERPGLACFAAVVSSAAVAYAVQSLIEAPCIKLGRRMVRAKTGFNKRPAY